MGKIKTVMNQRQKAALAAMIIRGIADILAHYEVRKERYPEYWDLADVSVDDMRAQAARWLGRYLPGAAWDDRLPRTFTKGKYSPRQGGESVDLTAVEAYRMHARGWTPVDEEPGEPPESEE